MAKQTDGERRLVVSLHDVMPSTLDQTEDIFAELLDAGIETSTLLIVPGKNWDERGLARLRAMLERGAIAAGHGWTHHAAEIRGAYHRLHSLLISRDAAEHLALDTGGIATLIRRNYAWFGEHELPTPTLYVPPAWGMGAISHRQLDELPFAQYEVLDGVYDSPSGRFVRSAMIGFEADTAFRAWSCRAWNSLNLLAAGNRRPVRMAIHPHDLSLELAADLKRLIAEGGRAYSYDVFASPELGAA